MQCVAMRGTTPAARVTPAITDGPMADGHRVHRSSASTATRTVSTVEKPGEPHRPPTGEAAVDSQDRPSALPRLPTQRRLAHNLQTPVDQAGQALDRWVALARRSRIDSFITLQRRIVGHRTQILASIAHGLSNGLTKIRIITRIAFGFASPDPLIALAMLTLGGHRPALPGRQRPTDQSQEPQNDDGRGMVVLWWRVSHDSDLSLR
jgi:Transposase